MGTVHCGDNLDILRRFPKFGSVNLFCLAPPFNSAQDYNAFLRGKDGTEAAGQICALAAPSSMPCSSRNNRVQLEVL